MTDPAPSVIPLAAPWLPPDCAEAVRKQVASSFVGPGATSARFGDELAACAGVVSAVPVSSGTVALTIAAQVLGLKPGDEVVVPAYGVISVINSFASAGFAPRLAEIDRTTGCIDPQLLEQAVTPRTKAVCFVDFCGSIGPELDLVAKFCRSRAIPLIEDAAWALGRGKSGRMGGGIGDIGTTSFSVPKIITCGQGGAVFAKSEQMRDQIISAVDQGDIAWRSTNLNRGIGSNLRISDVSAALGLAQLNQLEVRTDRKRRVFAALTSILGERLFKASDGDFASQYVIFVEDPDSGVAALRSKGILAARQYRCFYEHPPYRHLEDRLFPGSRFWSDHAIYLPFGMSMTEEDAERVGEASLALQQRFLDWR